MDNKGSLDIRKLESISNEMSAHRNEIIEMEKGFIRCAFGFVTIAIGLIGLILGKDIISNDILRDTLILCFTQIEFFIALVALALLSNLSIHAAYISCLEKKVNSLCQETILCWESELSPRYIFHPRGSYFWITFLLIIFFLSTYFFLIYMTFRALNGFGWKIFFTIETVILAVLLALILFERQKVIRHTEGLMDLHAQQNNAVDAAKPRD